MRTYQPTASPDWSQGAHSFCPERGFCRQLHQFTSYLRASDTPVLPTLLYPWVMISRYMTNISPPIKLPQTKPCDRYKSLCCRTYNCFRLGKNQDIICYGEKGVNHLLWDFLGMEIWARWSAGQPLPTQGSPRCWTGYMSPSHHLTLADELSNQSRFLSVILSSGGWLKSCPHWKVVWSLVLR